MLVVTSNLSRPMLPPLLSRPSFFCSFSALTANFLLSLALELPVLISGRPFSLSLYGSWRCVFSAQYTLFFFGGAFLTSPTGFLNPSLGFFPTRAWRFIYIYPRVFSWPVLEFSRLPLGFFLGTNTRIFSTSPSFFMTRPSNFLTSPSGFFLDPSSGSSRFFSNFFGHRQRFSLHSHPPFKFFSPVPRGFSRPGFLISSPTIARCCLPTCLLRPTRPCGGITPLLQRSILEVLPPPAYLRLFERLNRLPRESGSLNRYIYADCSIK